MTEHRGKNVLIVDDSHFIRETIGTLVQQMGHRVLKAGDGFRGMVLARTQSPDLIILDVKMPKMGGLEVLKELRTDPRFKSTPIVMLTSQSDIDIVAQAAAGQISAYILKDDPNEIMKRLREYL